MLFLWFCLGALHSGMGFPHHTNLTIIGGDPIDITKVPFMASLHHVKKGFICGGTIIHERFILTAAHCLISQSNKTIYVTVGISSLNQIGDIYEVDETISNENFDHSYGDYDVALVKVSKPIVFGSKVKKIGLPTHDMNLQQGDVLTALGWGYTSSQGTETIDLMSVKLPVVPNDICQKFYDTADINLYPRLTKRMLCAGDTKKGACHGDSGGPLVHSSGIQVGITSWRYLSCEKNPSVFARVSELTDWISRTIARNL